MLISFSLNGLKEEFERKEELHLALIMKYFKIIAKIRFPVDKNQFHANEGKVKKPSENALSEKKHTESQRKSSSSL